VPRSRPYPRYRRVCFLGACPSRSHAIRDPLGSPGLQSPFPGRDLYRTGAEVQAIQPSPCHPGLAVPAPQRFQGSTAFRTCCCPLQVSPSGRSGDPKVSRSTFPVLHGDQRRRYSAHRGRSAGAHCLARFGFNSTPDPFFSHDPSGRGNPRRPYPRPRPCPEKKLSWSRRYPACLSASNVRKDCASDFQLAPRDCAARRPETVARSGRRAHDRRRSASHPGTGSGSLR